LRLSGYDLNLKEALMSLTNGILIINTQENIVFLNKVAETLTDLREADVVDKKLLDVLPNSRGLVDVLKTGVPEKNVIVKTKQYTLISNRTPIYKDGLIIGAIALFQDLTSLRHIFEEIKELKEINEELNGIINASYDGLLVVNKEGFVFRASPSYERLTGLKNTELLGRNVKELEQEGTLSQSVTLQVFQRKECVSIQQRFKTGKEIFITGTPIFDEEGQISKVVINSRDLTDLERIKGELNKSLKAIERTKNELNAMRLIRIDIPNIIFQSPQMMKIIDYSYRAAKVDATVLITGESGVGKGEIAKYIHNASKRKSGAFISINCGAIPENLLESELFGYEKGAFTGASQKKMGLFELANNGTLFLDEVADLPLNLQVKLLKVLQENKLYRLGGLEAIDLDVRILAATNRNVDQYVKSGQFRQDLFYRLNVLPLNIPPLRERPEDILLLVNHFLDSFNKKYETNKSISLEAIDLIEKYSWNGNVRELKNCIERLVILSDEDKINVSHMPYHIVEYSRGVGYFKIKLDSSSIVPLREAREALEKELIEKTISKYKSTRKTAEILQVDHSTIVRKLKKYRT
jgi:PAS domain S-box-containing protein